LADWIPLASRYGFDKKKIARFHKEGRGTGHGDEYLPWLKVSDVASRGRSHRLLGATTGRVHHLLSDLERNALLIYDFREDVVDLREQFPLDRDETQIIAEQAGIRHPVDTKSRVALVQTTDIVVDLSGPAGRSTLARAIKPASELGKKRAVEKLEIERRYWTARGVCWGLITERDMPKVLIRNLEMLQAAQNLEDLTQPYDGYFQDRAALIAAELESWAHVTLQEFCRAMDLRFGLETGGALLLVRHLLACKTWKTDMLQPITDTMPLSRIWRNSSAVEVVQA